MIFHTRKAVFLALFIATLTTAQTSTPSNAELQKFLDAGEARLNKLAVKGNRAGWVQETYITDDTQAISAEANDEGLAAITELVKASKKFDGVKPNPEQARKLLLLKLSGFFAPDNPAERAEMTELAAWLDGTYGKGKYCPKSGPYAGKCLGQSDMETAMAEARDPAVLLDLWTGWHTISPPMRQKYSRFIDLANKGAREMDFADTGAIWRSGYDMTPEQ